MRATVGILSILGLSISVAVAAAQAPRSTNAPQRRAILLPPEPLPAGELPRVVRAAAEDLTDEPVMTPVVRPTTRNTPNGPGWLNGTDPNVRPAGGIGGNESPVRSSTPRNASAKDEPSMFSRGLDKLKGAFGGTSPSEGTKRCAGPATARSRHHRGERGNGLSWRHGHRHTCLRWPAGLSLVRMGLGDTRSEPERTDRTVSARFRELVLDHWSNPRGLPGAGDEPDAPQPWHRSAGLRDVSEPPNSAKSEQSRAGMSMPSPVSHNHPIRNVPPPADLSRIDLPNEFRVPPTPTITVPPVISPEQAPRITPVTTDKEPPIRPITSLPPLPQLPEIVPTQSAITHSMKPLPAQLPVSVTEEPSNWQPRSETIAPGEWGPAGGKPRPSSTPPPRSEPIWQQPGASNPIPAHPIARGQAEDSQPDPKDALIRSLCSGAQPTQMSAGPAARGWPSASRARAR